MNAEESRIPITDLIKVWCEYCRIRIDPYEERTRVGGNTYHPHCYAKPFSAIPTTAQWGIEPTLNNFYTTLDEVLEVFGTL